jgi:hypothetical protein
MIQRNAIKSWKSLHPTPEVILFGDEEGTSQSCDELGTVHFPRIRYNEYGTPYVNSLFEEAPGIARGSILCYINADVILMSDFIRAVKRIEYLQSFLMVGRRWNVDITEALDFTSLEWEGKLRSAVLEKGKLFTPSGIDYFVFNRDLWGDAIPPFAVGRTAWDNWFIYRARKMKVPVIDATQVVMAVHQNHEYNPDSVSRVTAERWEGPEIPGNRKLAGKYALNYSISDASKLLTENGLTAQGSRVKIRRFLVTHFPCLARTAVRMARYVGLYPEKEELT